MFFPLVEILCIHSFTYEFQREITREGGKERETALIFNTSLFKWLQHLGWEPAKAGDNSIFSVSGRDPTTCAIFCCLPACTPASLNLEQSLNPNLGIQIWNLPVLKWPPDETALPSRCLETRKHIVRDILVLFVKEKGDKESRDTKSFGTII